MQFKVTFKDVDGEWSEIFIHEKVRSLYAAVRFGKNQARIMNETRGKGTPEVEFVSAELVKSTRIG